VVRARLVSSTSPSMAADVVKRPFITLGMATFLMLLALA
jgi:DMSO/TMAO reductase YedYZ heme-binding membrane subunit